VNDVGTVALARAPCAGMGGAGFDLFAIDALGNVTKSGFNSVGNTALTLSNAHALALAPSGTGGLLVFTESAQALLANVSDVGVGGQGAASFGGAAPLTGAWIATTNKLVALLALSPNATPPPMNDAGAPIGDAGTGSGNTGGELRLHVVPPNADFTMLPAPITMPGSWGSIAASGSRVFVAADGTIPGQDVVWSAFDLGGASAAATNSIAAQGLGKVSYADATIAKDRLFFAVEQPGSISLVAYGSASAQPMLIRQKYLPDDPRVPSMKTIRDGRVAVAASDTRVVVAWTTAKSLTENDPTGGYAVFACTQ
jgi:hypothetical protein